MGRKALEKTITLKTTHMTQKELDDVFCTAASVDLKDSAVVIGVMHANGQVEISNIGSERGRKTIWEAVSMSNSEVGRVVFSTGRRGA